MTYDDYLKMLKQERGISPDQYGNEIIWPTLALRRLAAQQITPSEQEINEAFESQYGEAVKARIIVCENMQDAQSAHAKVTKDPALFAVLAKNISKDPSASQNGLIPPIRRYVGDKALENAAFSLRENQISPIVTMNIPGMKKGEQGAQQFVILKCEGRLDPVKVDFNAVKEHLADTIRDRKLRDEAAKIYRQLEQNAKIQNVYNDATLRQQHPTVAALVNGQPITDTQLAEECVMRHGENVLESLINRRLLEREL
jgi:parvulin-like peptidyl-prolyl isomerase